ncbi:MAG: H-NS histone family protein [Lamprobacter sp.]|uniref:H-NS histone family protein n=1 Tax=Lamprobacter sp. TaxID=3100796 RepID=UPI002B261024|nr:H-NS histone family protein [Lamprobacter sp.]MEA3640153.1 H-NS histone family protein [Lamprobacter sp.]
MCCRQRVFSETSLPRKFRRIAAVHTDQTGQHPPGRLETLAGRFAFLIHPPRRRVVEYQHLSAEELKNQIEQTKQREAELQKALNQRWQAEKSELANQIRDLIESRGHDVEDIMNHLSPTNRRRRTGNAGKKAGTGNYTRYFDPENPNNVYSRGVLPRWMKDKMASLGLDSSNKEDRESFKANHLQPIGD